MSTPARGLMPRAPVAGSRAAGFTILEVAVSMAILGSLTLLLFTVMVDAQQLEVRSVGLADLRSRARAAVDRIARELMDSGPSQWNMPPTAPLGASGLTYRRAAGFVAGAVTWTAERRIEWALAPGETLNGLDDNRDGLVDEGIVRYVENPAAPTRIVTLATGVPRYLEGEVANNVDDALDRDTSGGAFGNQLVDEQGLAFKFDPTDRTLTTYLTLARRIRSKGESSGFEVLQWTARTTVYVRNP